MIKAHSPYYYQAVLMDLMMPVLDGLKATQQIRQLPAADAKNIPIIALTADVTEKTMERCIKSGMNDCICKPVDPDELFSCLAREFEVGSDWKESVDE
jgi:two-component system CheB/CheR fusion protein